MILGKKETYLDWASAAPVSKTAWKVFLEASKEQGNPSSPHAAGVRAKTILERSRTTIARLARVKSENVLFTSGATESNNLAIHGHIQALAGNGRAFSDMHILYLPTAHASVVESIEALARSGVQIEALVLTDGTIDLTALQSQIHPETVLVATDLVCGETGTLFKVRDIRRTLDKAHGKTKSRPLLFVDASQAPFTESFELTQLGADLLTLDAQKVGGVRGIGALIRAHAVVPLAAVLYGGGQEQGLRPGTQQHALAAAFAAALEECAQTRTSFSSRSAALSTELITSITTAFPDLAVVNKGKNATPHILNLSFPGLDTDYAVMLLSKEGFMVSTKSACETNEEGSRAVQILTGDNARARSALRISWGPTTAGRDLRVFARVLIKTLKFLTTHTI